MVWGKNTPFNLVKGVQQCLNKYQIFDQIEYLNIICKDNNSDPIIQIIWIIRKIF